jgi:hypothetical protein
MATVAAIMVAILAAIFNMVAKTDKKFRRAPMLQLQRKLIFRGYGRQAFPYPPLRFAGNNKLPSNILHFMKNHK